MKVAVLIMCHIDAHRVNRLISAIDDQDIDIYVHVDKKSSISNEISVGERTRLLPDTLRVDVRWAQLSQVKAELNLIKYAHSFFKYDYYALLSGYDYPIVSMPDFKAFLLEEPKVNYISLARSKNYLNNGRPNNFDKRNDIYFPNCLLNQSLLSRLLRRIWVELTGGYNRTFNIFKRVNHSNITDFYFGSQWWCLTGSTIDWIIEYLKENQDYLDSFEGCCIPDESFFQTLFMNSPYAELRRDSLHYIDWSEHKNNPKWLTVDDFDSIKQSDKYFARKIADEKLLDAFDEYINQTSVRE